MRMGCCSYIYIYIWSFSRRFYPKQLTYVRLTMYTHFTFTLMAHCTSGAIRAFSDLIKDASTGNRISNLLITKRLLYLLYHCRPCLKIKIYTAKQLFHIPFSPGGCVLPGVPQTHGVLLLTSPSDLCRTGAAVMTEENDT